MTKCDLHLIASGIGALTLARFRDFARKAHGQRHGIDRSIKRIDSNAFIAAYKILINAYFNATRARLIEPE
jgi:hypothetical protein